MGNAKPNTIYRVNTKFGMQNVSESAEIQPVGKTFYAIKKK
jgi:hypothetical protein